MPTTILQAPVGAGKTEVALRHLAQVVHNPDDPFAKVWTLLATRRQEVAFRQRVIDYSDGQQVYFNVEFFNFYDLNAHILNLAGYPPRRINDSARFDILRTILRQLKDEGMLVVYTKIAELPGFARVVGDFIYELKQNQVLPQIFKDSIQTQKDFELALIYSRYQQTLIDYDLVDREGEGWLALEQLRQKPHLGRDVSLLLVDGYDQFTSVQADLLALLSSRVADLKITLTTVPGPSSADAHTVGKRFERALETLRFYHDKNGASLKIFLIPDINIARHTDLIWMGQTIFQRQGTRRPNVEAVQFIEAPDPEHETAAVLRRVKTLLLQADSRPDDILIALRDWGRYQAHFETYRRLFNIPVAMHRSDSLAHNPAVSALLNLLELSNFEFRRRDLLDALRSPYITAPGLDTKAITQLDLVSLQFQVTGGRELWMEAIEQASHDFNDEDGEPIDPILTDAEAGELSLALEAFFDFVSPKSPRTVENYVNWIEDLIGIDEVVDADYFSQDAEEYEESWADLAKYSLNMLRAVRDADNQTIVSRDLAAMSTLKELLRGFLSTQDLLRSTLGEPQPVSWLTFYTDLKNAIQEAVQTRQQTLRTGKVLVTTAADARGLPHKHVFVLGLAEGVFPVPTPEDPLYLDSERRALIDRGVMLQTQAERADDEGLFYELISLPRTSLVLSRPTSKEGKPWIESHLWREVQAVFGDIPMQNAGIGEVIPVSQAVSMDEVLLAVVDGFNNDIASSDVIGMYNWLLSQTESRQQWQHIALGRAIETERLSRSPHNHYSGVLKHPVLLEQAAQTVGPARTWSASQFNEYGLCGFRFFARRMLRLEAFEEPVEGLDALQLGTLNHAILEETYRRLQEYDITIAPENETYALDILAEVAEEKFRTAPRELQFRETSLWEHEKTPLLRRLEAIVKQDFSSNSPLDTWGIGPRKVYQLEAPFGSKGSPSVEIELDDTVGKVKVRGLIDRIDRRGDTAIIVDYKTGSTGIPVSEMEAGHNFQMMVYLLAAQEILKTDHMSNRPNDVGGGTFWHIRNQKPSGQITLDARGQNSVEMARSHLSRHIALARSGDFASSPAKSSHGRCSHYCEFHQFCRISVTHRHKHTSQR